MAVEGRFTVVVDDRLKVVLCDLGEELKETQRRLNRGALADGGPAAKRRKVDVKVG